ncbi:unnamed protein product [Prorocentrum cordatum]|uniref:Uncharacterized protein n=1 Tax=Prorocentrum cordatum TaxID=2364126 RepID=A0ABN9S4V2_9DINO|nr:unnamed protein product [Polarella glacialis]
MPTSVSQALCSLAGGKAPPTDVSVAYGLFGACALTVYHFVANGEFSAVLTMAVMLQCLAISLLCLQTLANGSATGLSARALGMEAASLALRLSSTTWLNGYLPVDASGDLVYQLVDACSLAMVLWLLRQVAVVHRGSYQADADTLPVGHMLLGAFALAALLHDMNSRPVFDTLWMAGLFVGVVSVLPQLWLVSKTGGVVQACTSHWIAMMAASRVMSGIFMWHARFDVTCSPWVEGFSHAIWAILAAHLVHLVLLGDFAYCYLKAIATQGLACNLDLRAELDIV